MPAASPWRTALTGLHELRGAKLVDFHGWLMPLQYTGILAEHEAVRTRAGLFDLSHMGRLEIFGTGAPAFLQEILTIDVLAQKPGRAKYGFALHEQGGILDDLITYRRGDSALLVVNASNREKILGWMEPRRPAGVEIRDRTLETALIGVQGPKAAAIVREALDTDPEPIAYYAFREFALGGRPALLARTGYTGEDGFEVLVPAADAERVWETLAKAGSPHGIEPCGLGARDTLRTEAGMPLYGHEIDESTNPFEAGLDFGVHLKKPSFVGRAALLAAREKGLVRRLVGFEVGSQRTARAGQAVLDGGRAVGRVTSGTYAPTLRKSIGMAYVPPDRAEPGTRLAVEPKPGRTEPIQVVPLPFYRRPKPPS